jgi:hypothetical protein
MKISVFGDVMWNYSLKKNPTLPIECHPRAIGGTLLSLCIAAKQYFDAVVAFGAVGEQDYKVIKHRFTELGINSKLASISDNATGACVLVYEKGLRTQILSLRQANMHLHYETINIQDIVTSDFIFVNGWSFLPESVTSKSIIRILREADKIKVPIIFDVLPHHIQKDKITDDYLAALDLSSVVICETPRGDSNNASILCGSALGRSLKQCKLFILFDWIKSFRVLTGDGHCLAEESTNYSVGKGVGILDAIALQQVLKYYQRSQKTNPKIVRSSYE